jgi:phenylpropionate dioxygenase-like ring-hydroxylating dioxygenase large terminal subunit
MCLPVFESKYINSPGDFVSTWIGERPVVVVRQPDGSVRAFLNRCAHRGVAFSRAPSGHADELMCPYHQWVYDLNLSRRRLVL